MSNVKFGFNFDGSVEVILKGKTIGTLEQGYEISGPNQDLKQWIFWDNDHQEGTTYGTDLQETLNTIQSELEES